MTKDELWQKHAQSWRGGYRYMSEHNFLAALAEYGAMVRKEDAKTCRERGDRRVNKWAGTEMEESTKSDAWECLQCAAAIENTKLP